MLILLKALSLVLVIVVATVLGIRARNWQHSYLCERTFGRPYSMPLWRSWSEWWRKNPWGSR